MKVLPSILGADFLNLEKECEKLIKAQYQLIHFDVMDGSFVPNISFGDHLLQKMQQYSDYFVYDIHLMVDNVFENVKRFSKYKPKYITFHYEAVDNNQEIIEIINYLKSKKINAGLAIKPNTNLEVIKQFLPNVDLILIMSVEPGFGGQEFNESALQKIKKLAKERVEKNYHYKIQVDGGINIQTGMQCINSGVDYLVMGTALFKKTDYSQILKELLEQK